MFITPAFAEATTETAVEAAAGGGSLLLSMLPIFLILAVFYFLVIRPQNKRLHEHRDMVSNLQKGDRVVTGGGIVATVKKTGGDDEVVLEVAEGVHVSVLRSTVMMMRTKSESSNKKVISEKESPSEKKK